MDNDDEFGVEENSEVVVVLAGNNDIAVEFGENNNGVDVSISGFTGIAGENMKEDEGGGLVVGWLVDKGEGREGCSTTTTCVLFFLLSSEFVCLVCFF